MVFNIPQSDDLLIGFKLIKPDDRVSITIDINDLSLYSWKDTLDNEFYISELSMNLYSMTLTVSPILSNCLLELFTVQKPPNYDNKIIEEYNVFNRNWHF